MNRAVDFWACMPMRRWVAIAGVLAVVAAAGIAVLFVGPSGQHAATKAAVLATGTVTAIDPGTDAFYRMAVDTSSDSVWVPSVHGTAPGLGGNTLINISVADGTRREWKLPAVDGGPRSSAVAAGKDAVWIAWGTSLVRFDKATGASVAYALPRPRYSLPVSSLAEAYAPGSSGPLTVAYRVHDLVLDPSGNVWVSREYATSVLKFTPSAAVFTEVPLAATFGSPDRLLADSSGRVWMTQGFGGVADASGVRMSYSSVGMVSPDGSFKSYPVPADSLVALGDKILVTSGGTQGISVIAPGGAASQTPGTLHNYVSASAEARVMPDANGGRLFIAQLGRVQQIDAGTAAVLRSFVVPAQPLHGGGRRMLRGPETTGLPLTEAPTAGADFGDWGFDSQGRLLVAVPDQQKIFLMQ